LQTGSTLARTVKINIIALKYGYPYPILFVFICHPAPFIPGTDRLCKHSLTISMANPTNLILNQKQTRQKIKRIAIEIYEHNFAEEEIILAGIYDQGYRFAQLLQTEFNAVSPVRSRLVKVSVDKLSPLQGNIELDCPPEVLHNKCIVLIDDVLNTGRTLIYSLKPFLSLEIKKLQTAVLVDRGHKLFPVSADYVGYGLSTTLKEHVEVVLEEGNHFGVYLH
jgi:pyrimidine operon attenuation protein / uracil phosphoribosyltransferase